MDELIIAVAEGREQVDLATTTDVLRAVQKVVQCKDAALARVKEVEAALDKTGLTHTIQLSDQAVAYGNEEAAYLIQRNMEWLLFTLQEISAWRAHFPDLLFNPSDGIVTREPND